MIVNQPNYTIRKAAERAGRTTRTISQWIRDGMECREVAGIIVIDHRVLMARLRLNAAANPSVKGGTTRRENGCTTS
ncbi:hypothetical protein [Cryobacterium sp. GrIS_2_6]|uniref:hypothetical protein n=1 Tax=Cryobacterium sp. GrIS_2_6 TaxID=3162785 RepID=UPI002DFE6986|nr:Xaa-Pro aminopeptidase [Cryobacterium psychrotolerans]MEC5149248.1 Xaa-Pro aminopeptidase [Cryobacterium psychrotolerans]MEC5149326.1 Xaa-Pro aminopeptidase [Cryobacterium psychrotolerans]